MTERVSVWFRRAAHAFAALVATGLVPQAAAAQPLPGDPPFEYVQVSTRIARPGHHGAIEEFYTKLRAAEGKAGIAGVTDVYVVVQGGRAPTFVSFRTMSAWHQLDDDLGERSVDALTRAFGDAEARRLALLLESASESVVNEVLRVSHGLSNWHRSPSRRPWPYMQVRRTTVKPTMQGQYLAFARAVRDARIASQATPELRWQVVEGPGHVFGTTRYFRGWQDRDLWEDELPVALEPDQYQKWMGVLAASIDRTETQVLRYREDLSRAAKTERTEQ